MPVQPADVDLLVRKVGHRGQREDEIRWLMNELLETVDRGGETLYKACGEDGLPLGLIGIVQILKRAQVLSSC